MVLSRTGQVIRCRAAVFWEAGKPLVIEEVEVASPQAMEVRLRYSTLYSAIPMFTSGKLRGRRLCFLGSLVMKLAAKKFGVNEFVNLMDDSKPVQEVLAEMIDGGVDRSIGCTGNINAMGWGVAVLVGVPHMDAVFKMHPINVLNEGGAQGNLLWQLQLRSDLPALVEMYMNMELELEKFITHKVPFSDINKAFEYMLQGDSLRCIIRMDG